MTDLTKLTDEELGEQLQDAERRARELRRTHDARMRVEIQSWTQEQLLEAAKECDDETSSDHCWRCAAFALYNKRETEERSKEPGRHPIGPGSSFHDKAKDIQVGDFLQWESRPGFPGFWGEDYEVVQKRISKDGGKTVILSVRRANTDEPLTHHTYKRDEELQRFRPFKPKED